MIKKFWRVFTVMLWISEAGMAGGNSENVYGWVNAGLGYSSLGSLGGVGSLNVQYGRLLLGLRGTANLETAKFFTFGDEMFDLGLLVGGVIRSQTMIFTISTGIARVSGSRYYEEPEFRGYRERISPVLGVPFEIQIILPFSKKSGVGAYGYLDLNREQTFYGIAASIVIGTLN